MRLTYRLMQHTAAHTKDGAATCITQVGLLHLHTCREQHALAIGMNDTFLFALICCIVCVVLDIFLGRDRALEAARVARKREEHIEVKAPASIGNERRWWILLSSNIYK